MHEPYLIMILIVLVLRTFEKPITAAWMRAFDAFDRTFKCGKYNPDLRAPNR